MRANDEQVEISREPSETTPFSAVVESAMLLPAVLALWSLAFVGHRSSAKADAARCRPCTPGNTIERFYEFLSKGQMDLAVSLMAREALDEHGIDELLGRLGVPTDVQLTESCVFRPLAGPGSLSEHPAYRWVVTLRAVVRDAGENWDTGEAREFVCGRDALSDPWVIAGIAPIPGSRSDVSAPHGEFSSAPSHGRSAAVGPLPKPDPALVR